MSTRRIWTIAALGIATAISLGVLVAAAGKPDTAGLSPHTITINAAPFNDFDPAAPAIQNLGKLRFLGGLALTSQDPDFGGYSGLRLDASGGLLLAISDAGSWLTAKPEWADGRITGLSDAHIGPLSGKDGGPLAEDSNRDAEAVTLSSGTLKKGEVLVAFEQHHRLQRFSIDEGSIGAPTADIALPDYAARLKPNRGFESVTVLDGGAENGGILIFTEGRLDSRGLIRGWLLGGKKPRSIYFKPQAGFDITDTAPLRDGGLIVLERRYRLFEGVKMRLRKIAAADIKPDAILEGEVLIEADNRFQIDNMEGVAVTANAAGETVITLISDDNFSFFQRTLLLQFALPNPAG